MNKSHCGGYWLFSLGLHWTYFQACLTVALHPHVRYNTAFKRLTKLWVFRWRKVYWMITIYSNYNSLYFPFLELLTMLRFWWAFPHNSSNRYFQQLFHPSSSCLKLESPIPPFHTWTIPEERYVARPHTTVKEVD